jgi:hypothetical protein
MKVSEAISKLKDLHDKYGDLDLHVESQKHPISDIYFCRDEDMLHDNWVQIDTPSARPKA